MEKLRIMSVFGTRPEAIKMCPLVQELANREGIESLCCVTAQHRQMLDAVLEIFHIEPEYDLDIMEPRQTLSTITTKCLLGLEGVLEQAKPVNKMFKGWRTDISGCRKKEELPREALEYIAFIEEAVGVKIKYVSVGAERDQYIVL